jgi:hypothetical protein
MARTATINRDFNDAGTEKSFKAGDTVQFEDGEFTNYEAAGLVTAVEAAPTPAPVEQPGQNTGPVLPDAA